MVSQSPANLLGKRLELPYLPPRPHVQFSITHLAHTHTYRTLRALSKWLK